MITLYRKSTNSNRRAWHIQYSDTLSVCGALITPSMATTMERPSYVCWNCQTKRAYVAEQARTKIKREEKA